MTQDNNNSNNNQITETLTLTKQAKKRGGDQYSNDQSDMVFYFPQRISRANSSTPTPTITITVQTEG